MQHKSTTRDNFKKNLEKQIIKDNQEKEKMSSATPPSSKNTFRIKTMPVNKKLR